MRPAQNRQRIDAMRSLTCLALLLAGVSAAPVLAQTAPAVSLRVDKLEKEMKAVQRKVWPNGVPVEPEIGGAASGEIAGSPASSAVLDLTSRVDAMESQLKTLTGQIEQYGFRLKKLEDGQKASESRLKALEPQTAEAPAPAAIAPTPAAVAPTPKPAPVAVAPAPKPAATPAAPAPAKSAAAATPTVKPAATTDPKRKALVDAVPIPVSNDPIEDSYSYGYRLWSAKLYPEAQRHLKDFADKYPKHKRASYARNLLGRAYFDDKLYNAAAKTFLGNYQTDTKGDRASESLSWLGLSLIKLNQLTNACKVYTEFDNVYGTTATAEVRARVEKGRVDAKCPA
jgi:TolA-binding protein